MSDLSRAPHTPRHGTRLDELLQLAMINANDPSEQDVVSGTVPLDKRHANISGTEVNAQRAGGLVLHKPSLGVLTLNGYADTSIGRKPRPSVGVCQD